MKCWLGLGKAGTVLNLASVVKGKLLMSIGELLSPLPSEKGIWINNCQYYKLRLVPKHKDPEHSE